jgi:16S rRNA (cytosine967-C5)-methyltransferase
MELVAALAQAPPFVEMPNILLDVPCTGTGTLRRHPDARWRLEEGMIQRLAGLQRDMLAAASRILPKGGTLVYSTCSLEPEENLGQVSPFLAAHSEFRIEAPKGIDATEIPSNCMDETGLLSVLPQVAGFDGAFAARLVKKT